MDDTPTDELISELDAADPADAPAVADRIAAELQTALDQEKDSAQEA